jgi:hypothetical protein|nr:MAG TPA: hypothetical protein [Caudoviricetes sp.]
MILSHHHIEALKFARELLINKEQSYICHGVHEYYKTVFTAEGYEDLTCAIMRIGLRDICTSFSGFVEVVSGHDVPLGNIMIFRKARVRWIDDMLSKGEVTDATKHAHWAIMESRSPMGWSKTYEDWS